MAKPILRHVLGLAASPKRAILRKVKTVEKVTPMDKVRSVSVSSKGQITLSSHARKQLGLEEGSTLTEVVVGNCVILMAQNQALEQIRSRAQAALEKSGASIDDINAEVERLKAERFAEQFPDLA
ncbi:MAG: AbrB/MazE/SpoVT family DNA-binding domain-containing protein [Candidatus Melainabacteria bacterium]|nr:AbrB/MazE/SpoVT family DNA-binding domain-containing protein [Candidatus Melainabacteria bacterium]